MFTELSKISNTVTVRNNVCSSTLSCKVQPTVVFVENRSYLTAISSIKFNSNLPFACAPVHIPLLDALQSPSQHMECPTLRSVVEQLHTKDAQMMHF